MITPDACEKIAEAARCKEPVSGLTHGFYRYPARFSPSFACAAIRLLTEPGDLVIDPFMGGGTTLVEAAVLGRRAIGSDISELAAFVSQVKTTSLSGEDLSQLDRWARAVRPHLNIHRPSCRPQAWMEKGYQRNLNTRETWRIRKTLEQIVTHATRLPHARLERFARCVALRTGQWALDCRKDLPPTADFRDKFFEFFTEMLDGAREFTHRLTSVANCRDGAVHCINCSATELANQPCVTEHGPPKLILTSPPYPGVHVLYHRWQVRSRRETPAPFWIADCLDGSGAAYYTFGDRKQSNLESYFTRLHAVCRTLRQLCAKDTTVVQMVSFAEPDWQLPKYLEVMSNAGFSEVLHSRNSQPGDTRLWRAVPNRRWYADQNPQTATKREVVLVHRPQ